MRLTKGMQNILIKKLSATLSSKITLEEFNEVFLFLNRWNNVHKTVPYGIFEVGGSLDNLDETDTGRIFKKWIDVKTKNIAKDFNKGRKLVRLIKEMTDSNRDSLAFNLSVNNIFTVTLTVFFFEYGESEIPFEFCPSDEERFKEVLAIVRGYIASVFFLDIINDSLVIESILDIFINEKEDNLIDRLIELGLIYR